MAAALDDLKVLNEQLAALTEAGVPLDLGLGQTGKRAAGSLEKINSIVGRRVEHGEPLSDALDGDEATTPTPYRSLVQLGLRSGNLYAALDGSNQLAASVDQSRYAVRAALLYPLVLCLLAYIGMIGFCLVMVPVFTNLHHSLRIRTGFGLQTLQSLRNTLPVWALIPPAAVVLWLGWKLLNRWRPVSSYQRTGAIVGKIPGIGRAFQQVRAANFADSLATLLEHGISLEEGLRLAANATGDANLTEGTRAMTAALRQGELPSDDGPVALLFPPLLRWALWHSEATGGRVRSLRMAATIYRQSAQRRTERLRLIAPIVACVVIGGGVTLMYGLALFVPVVELLDALTLPTPA